MIRAAHAAVAWGRDKALLTARSSHTAEVGGLATPIVHGSVRSPAVLVAVLATVQDVLERAWSGRS